MTDPILRIRFRRRPDGAVVLELHRPDGTSTWQRRAGPVADFFVVHDLTHYAVESVLAYRRGFYGLVAEGWNLDDFGTPWPRGPLPAEALPAEVIVGCFDTQRAAGEPLTAEQCNASARSWFEAAGTVSPVDVREDQLDAVRALLADLVGRWHATAAGAALELDFPHGSGASSKGR